MAATPMVCATRRAGDGKPFGSSCGDQSVTEREDPLDWTPGRLLEPERAGELDGVAASKRVPDEQAPGARGNSRRDLHDVPGREIRCEGGDRAIPGAPRE